MREVFELHASTDDARFDRFVDVQLTWDESMAEAAAGYLRAHPEKTLVVLAGAGHVVYDAGIPDRVQRRLSVPAATVLPADVGSERPGSADIFVATSEEELPASGLLGVFLRTDDAGLVISAFSDPSGAEDAGLAVGDRLVAVDDIPVPHLAALKLVLAEHAPGTVIEVDYLTPAGRKEVRERSSIVLQ